MQHCEGFYRLFKQYLHLCDKLSLSDTCRKAELRCRLRPNNSFSFDDRIVTDYSAMASFAIQRTTSAPEYEAIGSFLKTHEVIGRRVDRRVFSQFGVPGTSTRMLLFCLLAEYLRRNHSFGCRKSTALSLYSQTVKYYSQSELEARVECFLEDIEFTGGVFAVTDDMEIRPLTRRDVVKIYNSDSGFRRFYSGAWLYHNRLENVKAMMAVRLRSAIAFEGSPAPTDPYDPRYHGAIAVNNALTALSLHTPGEVNSSPVAVQILQLPFGNEIRPWDDNMHRVPLSTSQIHSSQYRAIRETYENVRHFRQTAKDPDLLLRRLWSTTTRHSLEDVIVDTCVAFEILVSSYLAAASRGRLGSHGVAIYVAYLLGKDKNSRRRIYDIVKTGFTIRNGVVHGRRMRRANTVHFWEFTSVLRHSIRKIMMQHPLISKKRFEELVL